MHALTLSRSRWVGYQQHQPPAIEIRKIELCCFVLQNPFHFPILFSIYRCQRWAANRESSRSKPSLIIQIATVWTRCLIRGPWHQSQCVRPLSFRVHVRNFLKRSCRRMGSVGAIVRRGITVAIGWKRARSTSPWRIESKLNNRFGITRNWFHFFAISARGCECQRNPQMAKT